MEVENQMSSMVTQLGGVRKGREFQIPEAEEPLTNAREIQTEMSTFASSVEPEKDAKNGCEVDYLKWVSESHSSTTKLNSNVNTNSRQNLSKPNSNVSTSSHQNLSNSRNPLPHSNVLTSSHQDLSKPNSNVLTSSHQNLSKPNSNVSTSSHQTLSNSREAISKALSDSRQNLSSSPDRKESTTSSGSAATSKCSSTMSSSAGESGVNPDMSSSPEANGSNLEEEEVEGANSNNRNYSPDSGFEQSTGESTFKYLIDCLFSERCKNTWTRIFQSWFKSKLNLWRWKSVQACIHYIYTLPYVARCHQTLFPITFDVR